MVSQGVNSILIYENGTEKSAHSLISLFFSILSFLWDKIHEERPIFTGGEFMEHAKDSNKRTGRNLSIIGLYAGSLAIIFSGVFFGTFSYVKNISIPVMRIQIPGFVFALLVCYLGFRYYIDVVRIHDELKKSNEPFSWEHFRLRKKNKPAERH